jgi:hypothetical protein
MDEIEALAKIAFPAALYRAVSEWRVLGSDQREWALWTNDSGDKWTRRLLATSKGELFAMLQSSVPATRLRVAGTGEGATDGQ